MKRITQKQLEAVVERINRMQGEKTEAWTKLSNGKYKANVGTYHLSGAYGGVSLHRMDNESGGVQDVFGCGHMPKRELYDRMHAFIRGMESKRGAK